MPRLSVQKTNFTAGELSPLLYGRTEIDRYGNAAKTLLNAYPVIHGGAKRRAGTRYFKATKHSGAKASRLIPFIVSRDAAYMMEVGEGYVRVFGAGGADLGIEVVGPYTEAQLVDIDYSQSSDTMLLAHAAVPIQRIRRLTTSSFDLADSPFTVPPFAEQGHALNSNLTLSATTVGTGRTITAALAVFYPSEVGRVLVCGAGLATITAWNSATSLTCDITAPFAAAAIATGTWYLDASPQSLIKPTAKEPLGTTVLLEGSVARSAQITLSAKTGVGITVTADAAVFVPGDVGNNLYADAGVGNITAYTDATHVTITITGEYANFVYPKGSWGISAATWRVDDVGKFVRANGGLLKIVTFINAIAVNATIETVLTSDIACPPLAWSLEGTVWSPANGYPRTLTFHEQRLLAAGSTRYPQTIWGSRTGEYLDFTKGTNDDDAVSFTLAADEINPISYLSSLRNLVVHTYGGEFSMQGGVEKPITPTNVRVRPETTHGSKGVRPVTIGKESVFVQRAGRKVRSLGYRADSDGYTATDLTVLAEHISKPSGVSGLSYQQEPDGVLWGVRGDGAMLSCTLDRDQNVTAWAQHITEGAFESVATIPNGDRDETWVICRRTVNGVTVRYIEIFDAAFAPLLPAAPTSSYPPITEARVYGCTVDSGIAFDNALGQSTFAVPHLIGKTVDIVADGVVMAQQVVPGSGNVTLPRPSFRTLIGLHFESVIALLTPEVGTGTGTSQGNSMRTSEITLKFHETLGATVLDGEGKEQEVPFRHLDVDPLDEAVPLFSGDLRIEMLGWERGRCDLSIVQDQPLPLHLLSVVRKHQVND